MLCGSVRQRTAPCLLGYAKSFSTSRCAQAAAPAIAEKQSGLMSLFFGNQRLQVPMTEELPDYQIPPPVGPPSSPPETQSTTLSNGIKIVSEATYGPTASVGIFINSGSVYEAPHTTGASNLLEYMAFKATPHRSTFRVVRELESMGANAVASASREQLVYNVDAIRSNTAEAVEVLADTVLNQKFNPWEVAEQIFRLKEDLKKFNTNYPAVMQEGLHTVAFQGALGRPLVCPEDCTGRLNADMLEEYVQQNFGSNRIVIAGAGMEHQELVSLTEPLVSGLKPVSQSEQPPSTYIGGDFRQFNSDPMTHSAIAFEVEGGWRDTKTAVATTVLQYLLGGGGSFSSGGPGKGMHSRLYRNVLNAHYWMHNCVAFSSLYNDTGILGIMASADSQYAGQSVDIICKEMLALTKDVNQEDLDRAKNAAICQVYTNLESRAVVAEDIGRQVLTYGHRKPVDEFLDAIRALKASDISGLARKLLKKSITYGAVGDIANMPRYEEISRRFK